ASSRIGTLRPGESAVFMGEVPKWFRINHPTHGIGFVSKSWTHIVTDNSADSPDRFDVYAVDVATGLAIFVRGQDFNLVFDAGSNDDLSGNRFLDFLIEKVPGTTTIDHLLISHAHRDHISMLPGLLQSVQVTNIWDSGVVYASCTYQTLLEGIAGEGSNYHTAVHDIGQDDIQFNQTCSNTGSSVNMTFASRMSTGTIQLGNNASMIFLHVDGTPRSDLNENSLVVMLELGQTRILLTGDAGGGGRANPTNPPDDGSVEKALIDCCSDMLPADILVLGHHGSMTSSREQFVDAVQARDFIVSSGPKVYGSVVLPDQVVIDLVSSKPNARVWRTDLDDSACMTATDKVGSDNDGKAGGCTNIHVQIPGAASSYTVSVM
ncbi:MAG: MBL fold metallo-hydrolase, partial [Woeseiaceae bacterium]